MKLIISRDSLWLAALPALFLLLLPMRHSAAPNTAITLGFLLALAVRRTLAPPPLPLKLPALIWAAVALLSLTTAVDVMRSFSDVKREVGYAIGCFATFFILAHNDRVWRLWHYAWLVSLFGLAVVTLHAYTSNGFSIPPDLNRADFHGDPLIFSMYLILLTPMALLALVDRVASPALRWLALAALPVILVCGGFTMNRVFFPAFVAVVLTFLLLHSFRPAAPREQRMRVALLGTLVILGGGAVFAEIAQHKALLSYGSEDLGGALQRDSRWAIWKYAIERVEQHPFDGAGFGKYMLREPFVAHFQNRLISHAHNLFLNYALQMGVQGALAFLLLLGALMREFWRLYRSGPGDACLIGIAGLCLIAGLLAKNMTDDIFFRENAMLFWSFCGMLLGRGIRAPRGAETLPVGAGAAA
jgi:O-antigen ligase